MFSDLYDYISSIFSWRWPKAEGTITAFSIRGGDHERRLVVSYEFCVGDDGPYTGNSSWLPRFGDTDVTDMTEKLQVGKPIVVRYRHDNPSVNKLDRGAWQDFESL
jgi:hypothetical protein